MNRTAASWPPPAGATPKTLSSLARSHSSQFWRKAAVSAAGAVSVGPAPGTSALTSVAAAVTSTVILAANASRKQVLVFNDSSANLYLGLTSSAVSVTSYTVKISPGGYYEVPWPVWTGQLTGLWDAALRSLIQIVLTVP